MDIGLIPKILLLKHEDHVDQDDLGWKEDQPYWRWLFSEERQMQRSWRKVFFSTLSGIVRHPAVRRCFFGGLIYEGRSILKNFWVDLKIFFLPKPKKLYKYRSLGATSKNKIDLDRLLEILASQKIWFSGFDQLNDPYEFDTSCGWMINFHSPSRRDVEALKLKKFYREIADKIRISCFSSSPMCKDLWAYYADSYTGVCLGFDSSDQLFDLAFPVVYVRSNPMLRTRHLESMYDAIARSLSFKHKNWKHEREWRMMDFGSPGHVNFPRAALKELIYGSRISPSNFFAIQETIRANDLDIDQYVIDFSLSSSYMLHLGRGYLPDDDKIRNMMKAVTQLDRSVWDRDKMSAKV